MAIFSRRTLQRLIAENTSILSKKQIRKHVDSLNRMDKERSLATEWEVVLVNALSKLGSVVHEKSFDGPRRGDIYFEAKGNPTESFLADITTISTKAGPGEDLEKLWRELSRIVEERGLRGNSFNLRVGAVEEEDHRLGTRVRLKIPGRGRFDHVIFNERFERFMSRVARNKNHIQSYQINSHEAELTIKYDPTQRFASCGTDRNLNPDYVQNYPLTRNTLYSALERKADQLKKTNFNGPLGIIVCDSDNSLLWKVSSAGLSGTTDEIVSRFLKENNEISFVILIGVHDLWSDYSYVPSSAKDKDKYEVACYLYKGIKFDAVKYVENVVQSLPRVLPKPVQSPQNAINWLKGRWAKEGMAFRGGYKMEFGAPNKVNSIKIPSRALLELLSGKVSYQEWLEIHDFTRPGLPAHTTRNPFRLALSNSQLFSKVSLKKGGSKDDDWIIFEFGEPDPAIGPFREPTSKVDSSNCG